MSTSAVIDTMWLTFPTFPSPVLASPSFPDKLWYPQRLNASKRDQEHVDLIHHDTRISSAWTLISDSATYLQPDEQIDSSLVAESISVLFYCSIGSRYLFHISLRDAQVNRMVLTGWSMRAG